MRLTPLRPGSSLASALQSLTLSSSSSTTLSATRAFSTSPALATKTISLHKIPSASVPPYPHGPRLLYKQSNAGLYGSARIRHGHNVSEKHGQVTPRTWRPNVQRKRLWSDALACWVRARLTTRVLRTVRKEGGIDAYVTKDKAARLRDLGPGGWRLRWLVMQSAPFRERYVAERRRLGLAGDLPPDNTDLARVMVDAATPGPLSAVSRGIMQQRAAMMIAEEFAIGDEAGFGAEVLDDVHLEGEAPDVTEKRV